MNDYFIWNIIKLSYATAESAKTQEFPSVEAVTGSVCNLQAASDC